MIVTQTGQALDVVTDVHKYADGNYYTDTIGLRQHSAEDHIIPVPKPISLISVLLRAIHDTDKDYNSRSLGFSKNSSEYKNVDLSFTISQNQQLMKLKKGDTAYLVNEPGIITRVIIKSKASNSNGYKATRLNGKPRGINTASGYLSTSFNLAKFEAIRQLMGWKEELCKTLISGVESLDKIDNLIKTKDIVIV